MSREGTIPRKDSNMTTATAMIGKTVKLDSTTGEILVSNIEEYVCGFGYMYFRLTDGRTLSFSRENIITASRKLPTGDYRQIHLKKVKTHQTSDPFDNECQLAE